MLAFFSANWGTILVLCIVAAVIGLAVWSLVRDKRRGKSTCSCGGCDGCPMSGQCHHPKS